MKPMVLKVLAFLDLEEEPITPEMMALFFDATRQELGQYLKILMRFGFVERTERVRLNGEQRPRAYYSVRGGSPLKGSRDPLENILRRLR
jgi:hypothetical protein